MPFMLQDAVWGDQDGFEFVLKIVAKGFSHPMLCLVFLTITL